MVDRWGGRANGKPGSGLLPAANVSAWRWRGMVMAVIDEGVLVRVELDCGFPLVARLTRQAAAELALVPGASVTALVKAPTSRYWPRYFASSLKVRKTHPCRLSS